MEGDELYRRFLTGGFEQLVDGEPAELADYLEHHAAAAGLNAPLFLAQAIRAVNTLFREHNEYGGIRLGFVRELDEMILERLPAIEKTDPLGAAQLARDLLNDILKKVTGYDPQSAYE